MAGLRNSGITIEGLAHHFTLRNEFLVTHYLAKQKDAQQQDSTIATGVSADASSAAGIVAVASSKVPMDRYDILSILDCEGICMENFSIVDILK